MCGSSIQSTKSLHIMCIIQRQNFPFLNQDSCQNLQADSATASLAPAFLFLWWDCLSSAHREPCTHAEWIFPLHFPLEGASPFFAPVLSPRAAGCCLEVVKTDSLGALYTPETWACSQVSLLIQAAFLSPALANFPPWILKCFKGWRAASHQLHKILKKPGPIFII